MKKYVVGFIFSRDRKQVLLIKKIRPVEQNGMFNGIGGKTEPGESQLQAMVREAQEETSIKDSNWSHIADLSNSKFHISFYAIYNQDLNKIQALEEEQVYPIDVKNIYNSDWYLYDKVMKNLPVLIALSLDNSGIVLPVSFEQE